MLPQELGCGSGMTCWRRLRDWQTAGVWNRFHRVLLDEIGAAGAIDWERACIDSASIPAKKGVRRPGQTRRIAANQARSAMLFPTATGRHWLPGSRVPTGMTASSSRS